MEERYTIWTNSTFVLNMGHYYVLLERYTYLSGSYFQHYGPAIPVLHMSAPLLGINTSCPTLIKNISEHVRTDQVCFWSQ